ncbi:MBL fold metallo-hydrolase [Novosphingobium aquae]|uniref:MBL fold metallo-hydrolase n=1 Tax=Novosphingobium aquae TaxID=3133435 RepID=A0ABU8S772_9SPHN
MNLLQPTKRGVFAPIHPLPAPPETGKMMELVPGVHWLRMGLPIALDHINLWALADGHGWTIVDTGIDHPGSTETWERLLREDLGNVPVTRVIVTHMHADHAGLAGWLVEKFGCKLWMTRTEYLSAQAIAGSSGEEPAFRALHSKAGWTAAEIAELGARKRTIAGFYAPLPGSIRRMRDNDTLEIGGKLWRVIAGGGHSPEHACLHCPELGLFISGDMVLPGISSNISVDPVEPDGDPLAEWFTTLSRIREKVPNDVLVLPSHGRCFTGLHERIDVLVGEQRGVLKQLLPALVQPKRADELFGVLFKRPISRSDIPLMGLATGETLALLNHLVTRGSVHRRTGADGVTVYQLTNGATL